VFYVIQKEKQKSRPNGANYVECKTVKGEIVVVWGSGDCMVNIQKVENANVPFQLVSNKYEDPNDSWEQHDYWIPESADIQIQ